MLRGFPATGNTSEIFRASTALGVPDSTLEHKSRFHGQSYDGRGSHHRVDPECTYSFRSCNAMLQRRTHERYIFFCYLNWYSFFVHYGMGRFLYTLRTYPSTPRACVWDRTFLLPSKQYSYLVRKDHHEMVNTGTVQPSVSFRTCKSFTSFGSSFSHRIYCSPAFFAIGFPL